MPDGHDLLNERQVASEIFGGLVSVRTLQMWRQARRGPTYVKIGRNVAYHRADLMAYLASCAVATEVPPDLADVLRKSE